jgi:hypothetical protein
MGGKGRKSGEHRALSRGFYVILDSNRLPDTDFGA